MRHLIIVILLSASSLLARDKLLDSLFSHSNINGTIIIESLDGSEQFIHNEMRANQRLLPASTFKIPSTLIALEEGVVTPTDTIEWDGISRPIQQWNQDQTLTSAFRHSCVPVYQQFASKIGIIRYQEYVSILQYGNEDIGSDTTEFWLQGNFAISPSEQISFLRKIINQEYPFSADNYEVLKMIMVNESTNNYTVYAKTGWAMTHGWFVGYVEAEDNIWIFATNIETPNGFSDMPLRKEITMNSLKAKGIL